MIFVIMVARPRIVRASNPVRHEPAPGAHRYSGGADIRAA